MLPAFKSRSDQRQSFFDSSLISTGTTMHRKIHRIAALFALALLCFGCGPLPEKAETNQQEDSGSASTRRVAEAGVGKRGRSLSGNNVLSAAGQAFFKTAQKLEFAKVQQALDLYRASNGHFPKSHDEFMSVIIEPNMIQLPELPDGERYQFDPKTGELMVEPIPD